MLALASWAQLVCHITNYAKRSQHALQCLQRLAAQDRIVLASIHQPRAAIWDLFTTTIVLAEGHQLYFGPPDKVWLGLLSSDSKQLAASIPASGHYIASCTKGRQPELSPTSLSAPTRPTLSSWALLQALPYVLQVVPWFTKGLGYHYDSALHGAVPEWLSDLVAISFAAPPEYLQRSMRRLEVEQPCSSIPDVDKGSIDKGKLEHRQSKPRFCPALVHAP